MNSEKGVLYGFKIVTEHWKAPKKELSKAAKAVVVVFPVLFRVLLINLFLRWCRRRSANVPRTWEDEGVELEDVCEVVRLEDHGNRPPKYSRVGKWSEVPPGYDESLNERVRKVGWGNAETDVVPGRFTESL